MTRALLWVLPAAVLSAFAAGRLLHPVVGFVAVVVLALAATAGPWARQVRRVRDVTDTVAAWDATPRAPVAVTGATHWRRLASALNVVANDLDHAESEAIDRSAWLTGLVTALRQATFVLSLPDLRVAVANDAARSMFSLPAGPLDTSLVAAVGSAAVAAACREAVATGGPVVDEVDLLRHRVEVVATPVDVGVLLVLTDRTAIDQAQRLRRDFVVAASHELKTPVTGIHALTDALDAVIGDDAVAGPLIDRLRGQATRISDLVHDLLDLRRLEDGAEEEHERVDLAALVAEVVDDLAEMARDAGVALRHEAHGRAVVVGVRRDLRLAVTNLVRNAVQYTDPGGRVDVRVRAGDGEHRIEVADTGIGIPRQQLRRVFERFHRADVARSRATGGTGLGLSLVRHAVERHGGRVEVESLLHRGSTFRVVLPVDGRT